jgi:hypothetical protein
MARGTRGLSAFAGQLSDGVFALDCMVPFAVCPLVEKFESPF